MPYRLEFEFPGLTRMTNNSGRSKTHWRDKQKERDQLQRTVASLLLAHPRPQSPLRYAHLTLTRHSSVAPDPDGLVAGFKFVVDALVKFGILVDDRYTEIGMPKYLWKKCPAGKGHLSVIVEESLDPPGEWV